MIWFFARGPYRLTYEVRCAQDGLGYEAVVTRPDGAARIARAEGPRQLLDTSVSLLLQLRDEGWAPIEPRPGSGRPRARGSP
jgi:hypothetical protein